MAQETQTGALHHLEGVGWGGRGDVCVPMADSCVGLTENNKIL